MDALGGKMFLFLWMKNANNSNNSMVFPPVKSSKQIKKMVA